MNSRNLMITMVPRHGAKRIRTADLLGAIQTLARLQTGFAARDSGERLERRNSSRNIVHHRRR
jgi:hypothetical protein